MRSRCLFQDHGSVILISLCHNDFAFVRFSKTTMKLQVLNVKENGKQRLKTKKNYSGENIFWV